jgi:HEAT repeats
MSQKTIIQQCTLLLAFFLVGTGIVWGYPVGAPLSLEKLTSTADIIFKGTVISTNAVQDDWFKTVPGFIPQETTFKIVATIKGDQNGKFLKFRHYAENPQPMGRMYQPQFYHFDIGKTYIVFAQKTQVSSVSRQLWENHTGKEDLGVILCSDSSPSTSASLKELVRKILPTPEANSTTIKEIIWEELIENLKSPNETDVIYAIKQLDQMSGGRDKFNSTQDFDRTKVSEVIHELMTSPNQRIAQEVIPVIGSHNPYLSDERTEYWLATIGSAEIPGLGKMDPQMKNIGGELYWKELANLADSNNVLGTRALAIRALGLVRQQALREAINRWLRDSQPSVRASATVLLADFPSQDSDKQLAKLVANDSPMVRADVARAIGFSQRSELASLLGILLVDKDIKVRQVASMSLLSFSPRDGNVKKVFLQNVENLEFKPLFLNALARENPKLYLDSLAQVINDKIGPTNWRGGEIPAFTSWKILLKYLSSLSTETLKSGKMDRYLDAMENVGNFSSSEPNNIYAFYVIRGMTERAKNYRGKAKKAASYDVDYYFNQVDKNPSSYIRE